MVHGSLLYNSNLFFGNISLDSLKLVLFWFRTPKADQSPWAAPGTGWSAAGALTAERHFTALLSQAFIRKSLSL